MTKKVPPMTLAILILTTLCSVGALLYDSSLSFVTLVKIGAKVNFRIADGYLHHLVFPIFLHGSLSHLLFNLFAIYVFAPLVELWYGKWRFLLIYLAMGIVATIGSFAFSESPSLGASGAIYGLMSFHIYLYILKRDWYLEAFGNGIFPLIGVNLLYSIFMPQIDIAGHIAGFLGGLMIYFLTNPEIQGRFPSRAIGILLLIGTLVIGSMRVYTYRESKDYFIQKLYYYHETENLKELEATYERYIEVFPEKK
ncbi:rhomboid family intramembrane serine protease [Guggenheimella bovis]